MALGTVKCNSVPSIYLPELRHKSTRWRYIRLNLFHIVKYTITQVYAKENLHTLDVRTRVFALSCANVTN